MTTANGYTYESELAPSPVSLDDLGLLKQTVLWTDEDTAAIRMAGGVLEDQVEQILDVWYGYVGSHPHLVKSFNGPNGEPSGDYLAAVRVRFGHWIRDLCNREWDGDWLAYQNEIARRHVKTMGLTDGVGSTETHVGLRYMIAFIVPITVTIREFLSAKGHSPSDVDAMYAAWFKAVTLSVVLWSEPYNPDQW